MNAHNTDIVLGPLLRYVGTTTATVWVETRAPHEVEVLGHRARTFQVEGHHYALVLIEDLQPGSAHPYEVRLDGHLAWPPSDGRPGPVIRTREGERQARLVFGSCRVGAPESVPYTHDPDDHPAGLGVDALWAYSRLLQEDGAQWPDGLLLLGDQVYADEVPPEIEAFIRARRDVSEPPGEEIADFEEYTRLYRETWSDPDIRWLLSTVPTTMIFDDHDVNDDWNISESWVKEMRSLPWWEERITGAFMAYWLYQHLGNLSPPELAEEALFREVQQDDDAGPRLRTFARMCDRETAASRWAYHRDFGRSRLLVIDSRAARVLVDGRRDMIDADEWDWIAQHAQGSFDHLILATTLPAFMPHGIHHLEAWSEAVCDGQWGSLAARLGERLRRAVDLEHWAAFQRSFEQLVDLLRDVSRGIEGEPPATITILSGDVHTTYVANVDLGPDAGPSRVNQIVCSPFRNPLTPLERRVVKATGSRAAATAFSALARACRVPPPAAAWKLVSRPTYDNSIGELELDERAAHVTISRTAAQDEGRPRLSVVHTQWLSGAG
ncbi:MAG: alkaline phosphatase D family protein [Gaiellaceae bacterium]